MDEPEEQDFAGVADAEEQSEEDEEYDRDRIPNRITF